MTTTEPAAAVPGLPARWRSRRPTMDDVTAAHALVAAVEQAVLGRPDTSVDEVRDLLADPDVDLAADAWLVDDDAGHLAAWAWAAVKPGTNEVDVDYYLHPEQPDVAAALLALLERRALDAVGADHREVVLDKGIFREERAAAAALEGAGFRLATTFNRMRIDLGDDDRPERLGDRPPGAASGGPIAVRRVAGRWAEADLRAAHEIWQVSFAEHFGHADRPYDEWVRSLDARSDVDWSQLWLAERDGLPVGMLLGTDRFVAEAEAGYVSTLGVLPAARGVGAAKALLVEHFAEQRRRGRRAVLLNVDTANVTDALRLYESAGMRPVQQLDIWRKTVSR